MPSHASSPPMRPMRRLQHALRRSALGVVAAVGLAACASASHMPMAMPAGQMAQAGAAASAPAPQDVAAGAVQVDIVNFKFTPGTLTIKAGTEVAWTNHDQIAHTVTFTGSGIHSDVLERNGHFSHTFTAPGTYAYICSIHPFMHGTVIVTR